MVLIVFTLFYFNKKTIFFNVKNKTKKNNNIFISNKMVVKNLKQHFVKKNKISQGALLRK